MQRDLSLEPPAHEYFKLHAHFILHNSRNLVALSPGWKIRIHCYGHELIFLTDCSCRVEAIWRCKRSLPFAAKINTKQLFCLLGGKANICAVSKQNPFTA